MIEYYFPEAVSRIIIIIIIQDVDKIEYIIMHCLQNMINCITKKKKNKVLCTEKKTKIAFLVFILITIIMFITL